MEVACKVACMYIADVGSLKELRWQWSSQQRVAVLTLMTEEVVIIESAECSRLLTHSVTLLCNFMQFTFCGWAAVNPKCFQFDIIPHSYLRISRLKFGLKALMISELQQCICINVFFFHKSKNIPTVTTQLPIILVTDSCLSDLQNKFILFNK